MHEAWEISADFSGAVYMTGAAYYFPGTQPQMRKYTSAGDLITEFGIRGHAPLAFTIPRDVVVTPTGKIIIVDQGNDRIQLLRPVVTQDNTKVVLVAGGGPYPGNHLWNATQAMTNMAYRALAFQGFTRDDIHYLSANTNLDLDGNGEADDVDGEATIHNLRCAIDTSYVGQNGCTETWAADADNLLVVIKDHGGDLTFRMGATETFSAFDLESWLAGIQGIIPGKVTLINDSCLSGGFSAIANSKLNVITSTGPDQVAYFTGQGLMSFSNYFWNAFMNGKSIGEAFDAADLSLADGATEQLPEMNTDGDAVPNEGSDIDAAANLFIGSGTDNFLQAPKFCEPEPCTPQISVTISGGSTGIITANSVTDDDGVNRVWAVLYTPDTPPPDPENPITDLPTVELVETPVGSGNYQASYSGFTTPGIYQVVISATDRLGTTSAPQLTQIGVGSPLSRRAIIVIGGNSLDTGWPVRERIGTIAYQALKKQGYVDTDIEFLSATNVNGVEKLATRDNLEYAIISWGADNTQDVTLFMVGENDGLSFHLNDGPDPGDPPEYITADDLNDWLDILQDPLLGALPGKLTVIMDADNAGFYLGRLTTPVGLEEQRIRIASTLAGPAHNDSVSYSKFFWGNTANGARLPIAHLLAKQAMSGATGNRQQAWLDSNSDNTGDKYDISRILHYSLGPGILLAGDDPVLGSAGTDPVVLDGNPMQLTLWVEGVTTTGTLAEVWAQVTGPDLDGFGGTEPVSDKVPLADVGGSRYEASYTLPGALGGTYTVGFYAEDSEGAVSIPLTATATRMDEYEIDDTEGQASPIIVDDPAQYHSFHTVSDEDWVTFAADAGSSYTITADPVGEEADIILEVKDPNGVIVTIDDVPAGEQPLGAEVHIQAVDESNDGIYQVRVRLDTAVTNQPSDYTLAVTTDGGGSGSTSVAGQIRDASGNGVGLAFVKVTGTGETSGSSSTFSLTPDGDYSLGDGPGTYELTASKGGYTLMAPAAVTIPETGTTITHLTLVADAVDSDGDGVFDDVDNCTVLANGDQLDTDSDGIGNLCDCDFNQDDFCGGPDFTQFVGCFNSATNGDPICEAADMNGDGFVGGPDFTRFISGFNGTPGPSAAAN